VVVGVVELAVLSDGWGRLWRSDFAWWFVGWFWCSLDGMIVDNLDSDSSSERSAYGS
jgi:hypothetical protein